tara:strand:- start:100 stop:333 length:234 start_codon:yes stop_codon:yes gene_type:complete
METILKSNDPVYISWVKSLLESNSIDFFVLDQEMSIMEGNITAIPVRILVNHSDVSRAIHIIKLEKDKIESSKSDEI